MSDGQTKDYTIGTLTSDADTEYNIDLDVDERNADKIIAGAGSSGTILINNINIIGLLPSIDDDLSRGPFNVQILQATSDDLRLVLSQAAQDALGDDQYVMERIVDYFSDEVKQTTNWDDTYNNYSQTTEKFGKLGLTSTNTTDDGIGLIYQSTVVHDIEYIGQLGDTLALLVVANLNDKEFITDNPQAKYTVTADLGNLAGNQLTIRGATEGNNRSTIDMNGHKGIQLTTPSKLIFDNVAVNNANGYVVRAINKDSEVDMTNVDITSGSIMAFGSLNITADGAKSTFKDSNITANGGQMSLGSFNGGILTFNDNITSTGSDINISGDNSGEVVFNGKVITSGNFGLADGAVVHLGTDAKIIAQAMNIVTDNAIRAQAAATRTIKLDAEVSKAENKVKLATITISGELKGDYNVIVNSLNTDKLKNDKDAITPFLYALNDTDATDESFAVTVKGSPYEWKAGRNVRGEKDGSIWYLDLPSYNPDDPDINLRPEVLAGIGLQAVTLQQTSGMTRNIRNKVAGGWAYNADTANNVWALTEGENAKINSPVHINAKVWSTDGGFDMQRDEYNVLGAFASYRNGDSRLNGKHGKYRSDIKSDIDVDSWLAGLYYRRDKEADWLFAVLYGGWQDVEAKAKDGSAKIKTDGIEIGAEIEAGHTYDLTEKLSLDPSLGISYNYVNLDDAKDNLGKKYNWKNLHHFEVELGAKLTRSYDGGNIYVKPSVVKTVTKGDKINITGLNKVDTYKDQILTRIEAGARRDFSTDLSGYIWANYTIGSDYEAIAGGLGLSYAW